MNQTRPRTAGTRMRDALVESSEFRGFRAEETFHSGAARVFRSGNVPASEHAIGNYPALPRAMRLVSSYELFILTCWIRRISLRETY